MAWISAPEVAQLAQHGSPLLIESLGRVFGIGPAERRALGESGTGSIPAWFWVVAGVTAGFVVGSRVQKKWPGKVPRVISG